MASFTISSAPWPVGTTVSVYPAEAWVESGSTPSGAVAATATVSSASTVAFTGLADNRRYVAWAAGTGVKFATFAKPAETTDFRLTDLETDVGGRPVAVEDYILPAASTSAAIQSAIMDATNAATTGGKVVFKPDKTYTLDTATIKLARNLPAKLHIDGQKATLKLTAAAPRAFDFDKVADYDTFQNIEITDFTVDADNIGGKHHVVLGNFINGSQQTRLNVADITIRRVKTINVLTDHTATNHRLNVFIYSRHLTADEATQTSLRRIRVTDCRFEGGNFGVGVGGSNGAGAVSTNCFWDDIRIERCWHACATVNGTGNVTPTGNYQIGSTGYGGVGRIIDCKGFNAGDTGIETNGATDMLLENCVIGDAWNNAYLHTNYTAPSYAGQDTGTTGTNTDVGLATYRNCRAFRTASIAGLGFNLVTKNSNSVGTVVYENCHYYKNQADMLTVTSPQEVGWQLGVGGAALICDAVILDGCTVTNKGWTWPASRASGSTAGISCLFGACSPKLTIRNTKVRYIGTRDTSGGTNSLTVRGLLLTGNSASANPITPNIDLRFEATVTTAATNTLIGVELGAAATQLKNPRIAVSCGPLGDDTGPRGLIIRGTATLGIVGKARLEGCDFSEMTAGVETLFTDATNRPNVDFLRNIWRVFPKPSAAVSTANFNTATFTTATGNQYIGGDPAEIHFATGTGAGITAIDVSKDGTTYENAYTQASGAMTNSVLVPVDNGDYVRITFATTAPTVRVRPRR